MQVFRSLAEIPADFGPTVVAIGNFDGVHRGHQAIIANVRQRAQHLAAKSVALTFDPHPVKFLRPEQAPRLITPMPQRLELLDATGLDATVILPFTEAFSRLSAHDFAQQVLAQALHAVEVHEGDTFRFGHNATAGTQELTALGRELGFQVEAHSAIQVRGISVSSSEVRQRIAAGDLATARALLGRPFSIRSTQARGRGIGTRLTVPTINLATYDELLPASGVYITQMRIGADDTSPTGQLLFNGITNAGVRPTFGELAYAIETYILNFREVDLTPETPIELCFLKRVREERKFNTPEDLKSQILKDANQAQRYFRLQKSLSS